MSTDRDELGAEREEISMAEPISPVKEEGAIVPELGSESESATAALDPAPSVTADPHGALEGVEEPVARLPETEEGPTLEEGEVSAESESAAPESAEGDEGVAEADADAATAEPWDEGTGQAASGFEARAEELRAVPLATLDEEARLATEDVEDSSVQMAAEDAAVAAEDADSSEPSAESLLPILEAVLFASPTPLTVGQIQNILSDGLSAARARESLQFLADRCDRDRRGIVLCEIAGGWQFLTREEYFPFVQRVARVKHDDRLTAAGIETLAVVAYRQPISRAEVDAIRGVSSAPLIRTLMDRGLVRVTGRASTPGNPFQYGTTPKFLRHFGLKSEKDLPDPRDLQRLLAEREATHGS